jgi:hypothetical protein
MHASATAREQGWLLALGFLFMPLTTITFAYAMNTLEPGGEVPPLGWVLVAVAGIVDLGLMGRSGQDARSHYKKEKPQI